MYAHHSNVMSCHSISQILPQALYILQGLHLRGVVGSILINFGVAFTQRGRAMSGNVHTMKRSEKHIMHKSQSKRGQHMCMDKHHSLKFESSIINIHQKISLGPDLHQDVKTVQPFCLVWPIHPPVARSTLQCYERVASPVTVVYSA